MVTPLGCQIRKELQISLQEKTVKNDVDENLWQVFVFLLKGCRSQVGGRGQGPGGTVRDAPPPPNFGRLVVTLSQGGKFGPPGF